MHTVILVLFFLSGAAGLVYEVAWARSLGLVFGGSHLAVSTVLAVYMGGQALGSALIGRRSDATTRPLRLFGLLEIGVGVSVLPFMALMAIYPTLYGPLARLAEDDPLYLTFLRTAFACLAMIVPTTLMGGTLPVLARFSTAGGEGVARRLSILYAVNIFGAVVGTLAAGFLLIRSLGVNATLLTAGLVSLAAGTSSLLLDRLPGAPRPTATIAPPSPAGETARGATAWEQRVRRLVLAGIALSGFCALGYEVLWTRMLTLVVGTSVYSFAIMLAAFLTGLGFGSHAFGWIRARAAAGPRSAARIFAAAQAAIGITALAATLLMRDLPGAAARIRALLPFSDMTEFGSRLFASSGVAFAYMVVPAFFMGLAFPAAAEVWSAGRREVGGAVGRLLAANTIGAILGAIASGFLLIRMFGIERSLHMLVAVNLGAALAVAAGLGRRRWLPVLPVAAAVLAITARAALPSWGRVWDEDYFAIYTNNRSFDTPEEARRHIQGVEVLYYHEGVNETVSVIRPVTSVMIFNVNGRPEASTVAKDVQVQMALGHLPMLLHPAPRRVFVLGTGTGMTLGAVSVHPEVERLVLAEIEPGVLGVARTFERWNHRVLDDPRLRIVFNDGRNHLATTRESFDVITADPIHPWSGGAGYLYTVEYFRSVAARLAPGGIACQWLPLYEMTVHDMKTVVRTFAEAFPHVLIWMTYYDAVLVGSRDPILVDEPELERRMTQPAVRDDLAAVQMGSADDLLSYFLTGTDGARAFGRDGALNTDDNVVLEFSAPASQGIAGLDGRNVLALSAVRASLVPFLAPGRSGPARPERAAAWTRRLETGRAFDPVHGRFLLGERGGPDMETTIARLRERDPDYAPLRFLLNEKAFWDRTEPALVAAAAFPVRGEGGAPALLRISAVRQFVHRERVVVSFVDNERREIYGQRYIEGAFEELDQEVDRFAADTLEAFRAAVRAGAPGTPDSPPAEEDVAAALRAEAQRRVGALPSLSE